MEERQQKTWSRGMQTKDVEEGDEDEDEGEEASPAHDEVSLFVTPEAKRKHARMSKQQAEQMLSKSKQRLNKHK